MFLFADGFFSMLSIYRLLWIRGRLGGGKTLLAVAVAEELQRRGITVGTIANIPSLLKPPPWREEITYGNGHVAPRWMVGACVIFDEAWTILDNRSSMSNSRAYGAFARKLQSFWIFPSVIPIDKRMSFFYVERLTRLKIPLLTDLIGLLARIIPALKPFGSEVWVYKYGVNLGYTQDTGWFVLAYPERFFGEYDTEYVPLDDGDISQIWQRTIYEYTKDSPEQQDWFIEEAEDTEGSETATDRTAIAKVRGASQGVLFGDGTEDGEPDKIY